MGLIDGPALLGGLGFLFNKRVTIQEATAGRDGFGGQTDAWADKAGHVDIPCVVSPATSDELKAAGGTFGRDTYKVLLQGHYPAIARTMRAVVAGVTYDITGVLHDSQDITTKLLCEVVA